MTTIIIYIRHSHDTQALRVASVHVNVKITTQGITKLINNKEVMSSKHYVIT